MNKSKLILAILFLTAACAIATDGPEPAPWWQNVENSQALAMKWLAALTVIAGGITAFISFLLGKVNTIREQLRQQSARLDSHGTQIANIALSTPVQPQPQNPTPP